MELVDAIRARRSVKAYDPEHRMSEEELRHLLSHAFLSPSSFNMQNWHVVVVTDQEQKDRLCAAAWNQTQVKEASVTLVVAGAIDGWTDVAHYTRKAPEPVREMFAGMVPGFYGDNPQLARDEALRSVGILGQSLMLLAKDMGYDSCPMIGFDPAAVAEIVGLPEERPPLLMLPIGKAARPANPRMGLRSLDEMVSADRYGTPGLTGELDES